MTTSENSGPANMGRRILLSGLVAAGSGAILHWTSTPREVATLAELKALAPASLEDDEIVSVRGYFTPEDGGGGRFTWRPRQRSRADEGMIVKPNLGAEGNWQRLHTDGHFFRPEWWGAVDATDRTEAFARMIAALPAGATVQFSPRTYSAILAMGSKPLRLIGNGATIRSTDPTARAVVGWRGEETPDVFALAHPHLYGSRLLRLSAEPSGIAAGDIIWVRDDTARVGDGQPNLNCEVHRVRSVANRHIELEVPLRANKRIARANIQKLSPVAGPYIEGLSTEAMAGTDNIGIDLDTCVDARIVGHQASVLQRAGMRISRCLDWSTSDWRYGGALATSSGQGYGLSVIDGSRQGMIGPGEGRGLRHTFDNASGYDITTDWIVSRDGVGDDFVLAHNGWGGHFQQFRGIAEGGQGRAALVSRQGFWRAPGDEYQQIFRASKILIRASFAEARNELLGLNCELPIEDCDLDIETSFAKPAEGFTTSAALRFLPVENKRSAARLRCGGGGAVAICFGSPRETTAREDHLSLRLIGEACWHGAYLDDMAVIVIDSYDMASIRDIMFAFGGAGTVRRFAMGAGRIRASPRASLTNWNAARLSPAGTEGRMASADAPWQGSPISIDELVALGSNAWIGSEQLLITGDPADVPLARLGAPFFGGQRLRLAPAAATRSRGGALNLTADAGRWVVSPAQ